jgi:hypothetical protein
MKTVSRVTLALVIGLASGAGVADAERDCVLEGTVYKGNAGEEQSVNVKFHSVSKYDEDANCRVRRGEKMQFKLPPDPRLQEAEDGSPVKYRYQSDGEGSEKTQLISIGT